MNSPTDFDIGPLAWVKSEIDLALQRADDALKQFIAGSAQGKPDRTQVRFSRTHLHQVQGALTIVGLDGVTQFAEALESLLETAELQDPEPDGLVVGLAQRGLAAIGHFLDDLVSGQPNQPLRLFPMYREIQSARGLARAVPTDLFFPNLRVRPPRRTGPPIRLGRGELQSRLGQQRAHFQRGLLSWLRAPQGGAGVQEMLAAVKRIESIQETPSARSFWWVASAFLSALADRSLSLDADTRQLCARIDLQIRRLIEGSKNVAERLMRDALYLVAIADSDDSAVRRVQGAYQLAPLLPAPPASTAVAAEALRRSLREAVAASEESWNRFCAGTAQALPTFRTNIGTLAVLAEDLGQADFRRLAEALSRVAGILNHDPTRHTDALAMETATAILLAQHALENMQYLEQSFAHQVSVMVERIHGCLTGTPPPPESEHPSLDEMSRRAQEKLLIVQVAKEIQSNLAGVEQVLDAFFRDPDKRLDLKDLDGPLHQVAGALTMMRHDDAVAVLNQCAAQIRAFAESDSPPPEDDFERVAEQLSLVGFFVDALQHGAPSFAAFVESLRAGHGQAAADEQTEATVEQEVEQQKLEAHALLVALKEQPGDVGLRHEIRQNLQALQKDADLVADSELGQQTKQVLSALAGGGDAAQQIDEAMATLKPTAALAPEPSAQALLLAQASTEEVDAELLEIFLDEGEEVLVSMQRDLQALRKHLHDVEVLTSIRRSVHTLKGSGRMVGLRDLGEVAWSVEQVLNLWLRQESQVSAEILDLLGQSYAVFLAWVEHLKTGRGLPPDAGGVTSLAARLIGGADTTPALPSDAAGGQPVAPTQAAAAAVVDTATSADASLSAEDKPVGEDKGSEFSIAAPLAEIFNDEARTHLATLQTDFSVLAADPLAATTSEMYRAAHTLASIAGTVGFPAVNRLGRALEMALQRRNSTARPGNFEALEVIRQTIAELGSMLAEIAGRHQPLPANTLVERLAALYPEERGQQTAVISPEPPAQPAVPEGQQPPSTAVPAALGALSGARAGLQVLPDELDEQLLPLFVEEALDLAQRITQQLLVWRDDPANHEVVRGLARLFHTLKGSARMAGAMNLGQMTHTIETRLIDAQREGTASVELIDDVDSAFDAIVQIVDSLQRGETTRTPFDLSAEGVVSAAIAPPTLAESATAAGEPAQVVSLPEYGEEGDSGVQRASLRVRADLIDRLVNETGELSIARSRIEGEMRAIKVSLLDLTENVIRLRRQLRDIEIQAETQMQSRTAQAGEGRADFDPLEFDRFTRFQELTRMMAESVNDVATVQQTLLKNLDDANAAIVAQARLNREVQQELMSIRMVPFGSIADRLYRIVRQAAKELGKRANLEIRGTQLELDRTVLDKMLAPLEHMLRNAVAHGLETTEVRRARGKPEIGEIALSLTQEGNEIILNFSDDGAGLDLDGLRARGLAAGLLTREQAADDDRVVDLIFVPGVSTASELSQLSGRGIGMDVLRSEVAGLGGRIEVNSKAGQGTSFRLYLPLTLALTKALLVRSGSTQYAIPSVMIEQVLDLKEKGLARIRDGNFAVWGENRYPFHYLPHLLGDVRALPERHSRYWVLLLRSGTNRIAAQVDAVMGNQEIVVKNIGPQLARIIGVDGATVLGNGQVLLILNPVALASRTRTQASVAPVPVHHKEETSGTLASELPTVMIVDDSLTVRKITSRLLAREGYQVATAKNGVEALEQLTTTLPDVMLVDIEMPRMDGFELTRNVRADKRLRKIPIIMITSRTAEKHRQYALDLGVNHYLGKPYQEDELLRLVGGYVKERRDA